MNLGPNANLYLRHRQAEYSFIIGGNETKTVPTQVVPPIHQPFGHSKSYDNFNNMYFISIRYLPLCTHCLKNYYSWNLSIYFIVKIKQCFNFLSFVLL